MQIAGRPFTEWKQRALGVKNRVKGDTLSLVAAGVAFFVFLSIFPALASVMSLYGLIADPLTVERHIGIFASVMPEEVLSVVTGRLEKIAQTQDGSLTLGLVVGVLVSLWSANRAMKAIARALNIAYNLKEERGFFKFNLITLGLTLLSSVIFIVAVAVVVLLPLIVSVFLSSGPATLLTTLLGWALFLSTLVGMSIALYCLAPDSPRKPWKQMLPGAIITALLFVLASGGFSLYVSNFGNFDQQYGALGAVVITMLWLFIGAFIFLLGAEVNAEFMDASEEKQRQHSAETS